MKIDLDAARAARAEAKKEAPEVTFGGDTYTLPSEMPFRVVELASELQSDKAAEAMRELAEVLLNGQHESFMGHQPSVEDFKVFIEGIMEVYAVDEADESEEGNGPAS